MLTIDGKHQDFKKETKIFSSKPLYKEELQNLRLEPCKDY